MYTVFNTEQTASDKVYESIDEFMECNSDYRRYAQHGAKYERRDNGYHGVTLCSSCELHRNMARQHDLDVIINKQSRDIIGLLTKTP
jgi:hypothetical protein